MPVAGHRLRRFDADALFQALDAERKRRGLSWRAATEEIWQQSAELNRRRHDHHISPATLTGMPRRRAISCQHALFVLRWLERTPESFLAGGGKGDGRALPAAGPDRRLRWNLAALYEALDTRRGEQGLSWVALAARLRCSPGQLTGIRRARFGMSMDLAMRIVQWLERPAADFVEAAVW